jgi:excinuclease ABC subunit C
MKGLFQRPAFAGFGPCGLHGGEPPAWFGVRGVRPSRLRERVRQHGPRLSGVYGMLDATGELVYVGKAKCLRSRLLSYFRPNSRDPKAGRIVEAARQLVWEPGPSEFAALLRELELIRRWQPRFNVHGQPLRRRRVYVCLGRRPAPYAFLATKPPATATAIFGPVPAGRRAQEAVRRVNDWFGLRDCPQAQEMTFADQRELFPLLTSAGCLRHEIGHCLGPCAAACTRADYAAAARAAAAFLSGRDRSPLQTLERDRDAAAEAQLFEKAVVLRDRLESLSWLHERLGQLRASMRHSFVYPVGPWWYLIHRGRVRSAVAAPAGGDSGRAAAAALDAVYGARGEVPGPLGHEEIDGVLLVAAWFRRHGPERKRTLSPGAARECCEQAVQSPLAR